MNQVSWLIYLADVADHLGPFLGFAGAVCAIGGVVLLFTAYCHLTNMSRWDEKPKIDSAVKLLKKDRVGGIALVVLAFVIWTGSVLVPTQNTVLAIAASQFGEQMLHTKTANLAEQALNSWLQRQVGKIEVPVAEKK